ncbi:TPA: adenosine deaminase [Campylobacter coli]|nr:adenosine deaminase [Campylobacter coli]
MTIKTLNSTNFNQNNSLNLTKAKINKKDEFYTQYDDIEKEIYSYLEVNKTLFYNKTILLPCDDPQKSNFTKFFKDNFHKLGLKKIISSSYNTNGKGNVLVMTKDDITFSTLKTNGDFRNDEIMQFRNESDFIITNPPFSLFREFIKWCCDSNKKFAIIGNLNAVGCKDIFPLFKQNKVWFGATISSGDRKFNVPDDYPLQARGFGIDENGGKFIRVKGVRWFVNIEHNNRNKFIELKSMENNIKKNDKLIKKNAYKRYDNYLAIEIPQTSAIPSDFNGIMGVPITFLDKYNPQQFEILGIDFYVKDGFLNNLISVSWKGKLDRAYLNNKRLYSRIFIRHNQGVNL